MSDQPTPPKEITEDDLREVIQRSVEVKYRTQKALADAMGVSPTYVYLIVNGKTTISDEIARFFGYCLVKKYQELSPEGML